MEEPPGLGSRGFFGPVLLAVLAGHRLAAIRTVAFCAVAIFTVVDDIPNSNVISTMHRRCVDVVRAAA